MKTLVILPNWVGDTVMAQPVLASLAASGRDLHALGRSHLKPLLELIPECSSWTDHAPTDRETIQRVRQLGADEAVIFPNSFRAAWFAYRAGIPRRWGYSGNFRRLLLQPAVAKPARPRKSERSNDDREAGGSHQIHDYDRLLAAMRIEPVADPRPRLEPGEEHRSKARHALGSCGLDGRGKLIGLFAGAAFGPSKRWPPERFARLADRLAAVDNGPRPLLIAGPGETELARTIREASGLELPILGTDLDLAALAGVLEQLDLLVTNDSGPMHLAAAVGTRCVALFGPTDPRRTSPAGSRGEHDVLWTGRWCSPCFRKRCPLLHHKCLRDIQVEDVLDRIAGAPPAKTGPEST